MTTEYSSFNKSNSTIARFVPQGNGPQPAVIAAIVWHNFRDDEIIYHGQQRKAKSLIRTRGVWTEWVLSVSTKQSLLTYLQEARVHRHIWSCLLLERGPREVLLFEFHKVY